MVQFDDFFAERQPYSLTFIFFYVMKPAEHIKNLGKILILDSDAIVLDVKIIKIICFIKGNLDFWHDFRVGKLNSVRYQILKKLSYFNPIAFNYRKTIAFDRNVACFSQCR